MTTKDLQTQLSGFEDVLAVRFPHMAASPVGRALRELYATKSASAVHSCVRALFPEEVEVVRQAARTDEAPGLPGATVPQHGNEAVKDYADTEVFGLARKMARAGDLSLRPPLPSVDAVHNAAARLLEAVSLQDGSEAIRALGEMGVLALCPPPEQ